MGHDLNIFLLYLKLKKIKNNNKNLVENTPLEQAQMKSGTYFYQINLILFHYLFNGE